MYDQQACNVQSTNSWNCLFSWQNCCL